MSLDLVSQLLILAATLGALAFTFLYAVLAPWWSTREGRHMMVLTAGLASLGTTSLLRRLVGEWPYYEWTVTLIYAVLGWELWRRVWLLLAAQADPDDD